MKQKQIIKNFFKEANSIKLETDMKKMNNKDARSIVIFVGISMLLGILISDVPIIVDHMIYSNIAKVLLIVSIVSLIIYFLLILLKKDSEKVFFTFGTLNLNLILLSLYLRMVNYLYLDGFTTKILILLNFIIVEFTIFYRRIIIKNKDYIKSIKNKTHDKFTKKDLLIAWGMFNIILVISVISGILPLNTFSGETRLVLSAIAFMEVTPIGIVACITGMAKYLYRIK